MSKPPTEPGAHWEPDEILRIDQAEEVQVASRRGDGSLRPFVTIWLVTTGDRVFVRSAFGTDNPWFRRALRSGTGSIRIGGFERDVRFEQVDPADDVHDAIDAAYHQKYDRHGPKDVGPVVGATAAAATLILTPAG